MNLQSTEPEIPQPEHSNKPLLMMVGVLVLITIAAGSLYFVISQKKQPPTNSKQKQATTMKVNRMPTITETTHQSTMIAKDIREELKDSEEIDIEAIIAATHEELGIAVPTPTIPQPLPTESFATEPGTLKTESAYIQSFRMYNGGKYIPDGAIITRYSNYLPFIEINSREGKGNFVEPIELTYTWFIGNKKNTIGTQIITTTGISAQNFYQGMYDHSFDSELALEKEVTLQITGAIQWSNTSLPSLTKTYTYRLIPDINTPGTFSIVVSTASDRSQPTVLDRKVIMGAKVDLFKADTQEKVATLKTEGSVDIFRNLSAGDYLVQADYKGYGSYPKSVTINESNQYGYAFLIVPIKPNKVDDYSADVYGQLVNPHSEFYAQGLMKNQTIRLMWVTESNERILVATTTTDDWGAFIFHNIPGERVYIYSYEPPEGWRTVEPDDSYRMFQVFSIKDRIIPITLSKVY